MADISKIDMERINGLLDKLDNIEIFIKTNIGFPDISNKIDYPPNSSVNIAPNDGWLFIGGKSNGQGGTYIDNIRIHHAYTGSASYAGTVSIQVPIRKGQSFYTNNLESSDFNSNGGVYFWCPFLN